MADLNSFKSTFKGDLVTPTEAGVVLAIKYAPITKLLIAIRGGHSPAGASSSEGGLVIDLSRYLTSVTVDAEKKLAYAGGGALWEAVDKAAIVHGLATVGGTVNHVCDVLFYMHLEGPH